MNRARAFTLVEVLATLAALIILLGLMVSLAHYLRKTSAEDLTRDLLHRLDVAMSQYVDRHGMLPAVPPLLADGPPPSEAILRRNAQHNCEGIVRVLKSEGFLRGQFTDLSVAYFDEVRVRDAWGSAIVFMGKMHPAIGMAVRGWFFFSAGPDRKYLTITDNLYSYDQPTAP